MRRKTFRQAVIFVFFVVLLIRIEQHFRAPHSTGISLKISAPPENCEFFVPLVLHIAADRTLRLNMEPLTKDQLSQRLALILKERLQPVLYVDSDTQITMQEFVKILELAQESNDKIQIRVVTQGNRKDSCIDVVHGPAG